MFCLIIANSMALPKFVFKTLPCIKVSRCYVHRWVAPVLRTFYVRRKKLGPEPEVPQSTWQWNYNAELYAFGKRLNEEINLNTLRKVFTHKSYVDKEERNRIDLGLSNAPLQLEYNSELNEKGGKLINDYVSCYLRFSYPRLPEEGIQAVTNYLTSDNLLGHVSFNIGTKDLILSEEFPPSKTLLATTFRAFLGALAEEKGPRQADIFIQDFVLTQLVGKDINDMWDIINPMGILLDIMKRDCRELPESRLIRESGRNTIQAVYNVGLYSSRKLIGMGPGETIIIAEEMAARDALKRLFGTGIETKLIPFGKVGHSINIPRNTKNPKLGEWSLALFENSLQKTKSFKNS